MINVPGFCVLLTRQAPHDPMALAKALAGARKTPLQDQMMTAKNAWGIIAEHLTEGEASGLVHSLKTVGVESCVVPADALATLPTEEPAKTWVTLAETKPVLIAAAAITITSTTTKTVREGPSAAQKIASTAILLGTGLPIKIGGKERSVEKKTQHSDQRFVMDVLFGTPLRRFRVNAEQFDYSFLKERKLYQVLGNFKLLLSDLVKETPTAWHNHGATVLLENKPMQTMGYGSITDVEREIRWFLTLMK